MDHNNRTPPPNLPYLPDPTPYEQLLSPQMLSVLIALRGSLAKAPANGTGDANASQAGGTQAEERLPPAGLPLIEGQACRPSRVTGLAGQQ